MSWEEYYEKSKGRPVRGLYARAIKFIDPSAKCAVDLGCGDGTEALDLLSRGLIVHAVDQEVTSIQFVKSQSNRNPQLYTHHSSLENWQEWPKTDFLFAYHSLPFVAHDRFREVIKQALESVNKEGIFSASFFGPSDDWVKTGRLAGISADDIKTKLIDFEILHFEEIRKKGPTALQGDKFWDITEVIARRL